VFCYAARLRNRPARFKQVYSDKALTEDDTSFHQSNQPHAMETLDDPVLCLVAWRDDFETPPVLTPPSDMS